MLKDDNKIHKDIQSAKSTEKHFDVAQNAARVERNKEKDSEVKEKADKSVRLPEKDYKVDRKAEEPTRHLEKESAAFLEMKQTVRQTEDLVKSDHEGTLDETVFEQREQKEKKHGAEKSLEQLEKPLAKTREVGKGKHPGAEVKPPDGSIRKESVNDQDVKSLENEGKVDKTEEPFKPPIRSKGKLTDGKQPIKQILKENEEIIPKVLKSTLNDSEEDPKQRGRMNKAVLRESEREKTLDKLPPEHPERLQEEEAQFTPPKPPVRTKSKVKGGVEKQVSRDTETDQDEQEPTRGMVKIKEPPVKQIIKPLIKEAEEKPTCERNQSVRAAEKTEQPTKPPLKQPVKPMRKEPKEEQDVKLAVEPIRKEVEQQRSEVAEDIPLLYISEDETFSEALTEIPANHGDVRPIDSFVEGPKAELPLQKVEPSKESPPEIDIGAEDEPQMQEAAVKIQAAFKGYKTRKDMRPVFKEVFKNQTAGLHGVLTLMCVVEGNPSMVRWLRNGQQITSDHRCSIKTTDSGECTLAIKNLLSSDSGIYTCEVVNKFGVTSYNGNITVAQTPQPAPVAQKPVHPPLAAITPLQLAPTQPEAPPKTQSETQSQAQVPTSAADTENYVESMSMSLWEAYNLTEKEPRASLQERRRSSLIAASSSE